MVEQISFIAFAKTAWFYTLGKAQKSYAVKECVPGFRFARRDKRKKSLILNRMIGQKFYFFKLSIISENYNIFVA